MCVCVFCRATITTMVGDGASVCVCVFCRATITTMVGDGASVCVCVCFVELPSQQW